MVSHLILGGEEGTMQLLVCGDLHLKPAADDYDLAAIDPPADVDAALIVGDLTHRAGPADIELARKFVDRLADTLPVVYIPGNHDPAPTPERVVEPISTAVTGHRTAHEFGSVTVVGWGCEQRSLSPALPQEEFEALDPRTKPRSDRRYVADQVAADLEAACYDVVCGTTTPAAAAAALDITAAERDRFARGLETVESTYDEIAALLAGTEGVLLATHVPPFNTSFDRHHAVGTREVDREALHVGSIALKLAVREHDVFATYSGHSHAFGYDSGDGDDGQPHQLNLGYRGIGTVSIDPARGQFAFARIATEES